MAWDRPQVRILDIPDHGHRVDAWRDALEFIAYRLRFLLGQGVETKPMASEVAGLKISHVHQRQRPSQRARASLRQHLGEIAADGPAPDQPDLEPGECL